MGVKMGAVAYLLPFLIVYSPALLLVGDAGAVAISFVSVSAGLAALVCAIQGWLRQPLALWQRGALLAAGPRAHLDRSDGEARRCGGRGRSTRADGVSRPTPLGSGGLKPFAIRRRSFEQGCPRPNRANRPDPRIRDW